jgi:hypothetical protein
MSEPHKRKVCWLSYLSALKRQGVQLDGVLEAFRLAVMHDEDFCWAASTDGQDTAARNALRGITYRMWPLGHEVPNNVRGILGAVDEQVDW